MRPVQKQGTGGYHLNLANANPPQTPEQATSRWSSFAHKAGVLQCLLEEQYQLCCYSELDAESEGLNYHIEHIENKSQVPQRTFDYANLAASALSADDLQVFAAQGAVLFGGHASGKQSSVDMPRFVTFHQPDCRRFFTYLSDGRVVVGVGLSAIELDQAQYTIDLLNLNSPFLINRRRRWWDELDALFSEHFEKGWSLEHLAAVDLVPVNGRLAPFFSLTRQFWGLIGDTALQQHAPQLL